MAVCALALAVLTLLLQAGRAERFDTRTATEAQGQPLLQQWQAANPTAGPAAAAALQIDAAAAAMAAPEVVTQARRVAVEDRSRHRAERRLLTAAALMWAALGLLAGVLALRAARRGAPPVPLLSATGQANLAATGPAESLPARLALVAEHSPAMAWVTDTQDRIEWANAAFVHLAGGQPPERADRAAPHAGELLHRNLIDPLARSRLRDALARGVALRQTSLHRLRGGRELWLDVRLRPLHDAVGQCTGFIHFATPVTDPHTPPEPAASVAPAADTLTKLPHRAAVIDRVQRAIAHAARHPGYGFALLSIDVDRFEQVNQGLGAAAGDELLRQIAERLQQAVRPGDALARLGPDGGLRQALAARVGGDEFVAVLEGVNSVERLAAVAERVLQELAEPYVVGFAPLNSSVSIGAVLHVAMPRQAEQAEQAEQDDDSDAASAAPDAEALLRQADTAMVEAKRAGRGCWALYDDSMADRVDRALALEAELRRALAGDELFVVYQPWLDLRRRGVADMAGVEALVRWRHPQRGVLLSAEFLGVAEQCGLMHTLGQWVLGRACMQFVQWRAELGDLAPPRLAVNLSPAQLRQPALVECIAAVLQTCGMQPQALQIEVTEGLPAQGVALPATLRALAALKALGVGLALDDFGTGYASLACLHQLPVDTVKIDRSLVAQAGTVEHHRVLLESTIRMAHALGLRTGAEGVETEAQAALMAELRCQQVQGALYSHPLEADALAAWVRARALQPA